MFQVILGFFREEMLGFFLTAPVDNLLESLIHLRRAFASELINPLQKIASSELA